jgi:hypothetical protein
MWSSRWNITGRSERAASRKRQRCDNESNTFRNHHGSHFILPPSRAAKGDIR